jgi:hypothetical protein
LSERQRIFAKPGRDFKWKRPKQTVNRLIEVFGDLAAADQVVKTASDAIHAGDPVHVQNASSK